MEGRSGADNIQSLWTSQTQHAGLCDHLRENWKQFNDTMGYGSGFCINLVLYDAEQWESWLCSGHKLYALSMGRSYFFGNLGMREWLFEKKYKIWSKLTVKLDMIFTPSVSDGCNSLGIVCVSVSLVQLDKQAYRLEFWNVGQVKG